MKEGIGYTVTLNIMITFIVVVFAFLSAAIIYFKSNKTSNVVMYSIEKYEGYNDLAIKEIDAQMESLGYSKNKISCAKDSKGCPLTSKSSGTGKNGYCVYECAEKDGYYYYRVRTNMVINIPIINDIVNVPIYSNTNYMYDYTHGVCCSSVGGEWNKGKCWNVSKSEDCKYDGTDPSSVCYIITSSASYLESNGSLSQAYINRSKEYQACLNG